jgi:hypothetical protein
VPSNFIGEERNSATTERQAQAGAGVIRRRCADLTRAGMREVGIACVYPYGPPVMRASALLDTESAPSVPSKDAVREGSCRVASLEDWSMEMLRHSMTQPVVAIRADRAKDSAMLSDQFREPVYGCFITDSQFSPTEPPVLAGGR